MLFSRKIRERGHAIQTATNTQHNTRLTKGKQDKKEARTVTADRVGYVQMLLFCRDLRCIAFLSEYHEFTLQAITALQSVYTARLTKVQKRPVDYRAKSR